MFEISAGKAREIMTKYEGVSNKLAKIKEAGEERTGMVLGAGLTVASAFIGAYTHGRYSVTDDAGKPLPDDKFHIAGVPADLLGGAALVIAGLAGVTGKYDHLAVSAGGGLFASNLAISGYKMGRTAQATDTKATITDTFSPVTAGMPYTGARSPDASVAQAIRDARQNAR